MHARRKLLVCFKPSNALFIFSILAFGSFLAVFAAFAIIGANYAMPVLLPHGSFGYLIAEIGSSAIRLGPQHLFCHNLSCGFRALELPSFSIAVAVLITLPTLGILLTARLRLDRAVAFPVSIAIVTFASLLVSDPSGDYSLILVLPAFMYLLGLPIADVDDARRFYSSGFQLILGFVLATGFVNIYKPGVWDLYTVARSLGLIIMYVVTCRYLLCLPRAAGERRGLRLRPARLTR